jgi:hypothetical protein
VVVGDVEYCMLLTAERRRVRDERRTDAGDEMTMNRTAQK